MTPLNVRLLTCYVRQLLYIAIHLNVEWRRGRIRQENKKMRACVRVCWSQFCRFQTFLCPYIVIHILEFCILPFRIFASIVHWISSFFFKINRYYDLFVLFDRILKIQMNKVRIEWILRATSVQESKIRSDFTYLNESKTILTKIRSKNTKEHFIRLFTMYD